MRAPISIKSVKRTNRLYDHIKEDSLRGVNYRTRGEKKFKPLNPRWQLQTKSKKDNRLDTTHGKKNENGRKLHKQLVLKLFPFHRNFINLEKWTREPVSKDSWQNADFTKVKRWSIDKPGRWIEANGDFNSEMKLGRSKETLNFTQSTAGESNNDPQSEKNHRCTGMH